MAKQDTNSSVGADGRSQASLFPMFLKLEGRRCLVVGAGSIAESKIPSLLDSGAQVHVVALDANAAVSAWAAAGKISLELHRFNPAGLDGAFLVIAATSSGDLNGQVFREARQRGILCNAVDDPEHCDFYYGAVVRRGALQFAISTAGRSPALAQRLRRELEEQFGPEYAEWLEELGAERDRVFVSGLEPEARRKHLHEVASRESFAAAAKGERS